MINFLFDEKDLSFPIETIFYFYRMEDSIINKYNLKRLEEENEDMPIMAVEINRFPNMVKRFNLKVLPTFIFFKNGQETKRIEDIVI